MLERSAHIGPDVGRHRRLGALVVGPELRPLHRVELSGRGDEGWDDDRAMFEHRGDDVGGTVATARESAQVLDGVLSRLDARDRVLRVLRHGR